MAMPQAHAANNTKPKSMPEVEALNAFSFEKL
jgi:hypothetical protein